MPLTEMGQQLMAAAEAKRQRRAERWKRIAQAGGIETIEAYQQRLANLRVLV
jgi:hypothetical protein